MITNAHIFHMPTAEECTNLAVGDLAITPYGDMREVLQISYRGVDINGNHFVGYSVSTGTGGGSITMSMKEGHLTRHVGLSWDHTASDLRAIEGEMRKERGFTKPLLH